MSDAAGLTQQVVDELKTLREGHEKLVTEITELKKPVHRGLNPGQLGAPSARKGEDPLSSRGYSFLKLIGYVSGVLRGDECKVEIDIHNRLQKALCTEMGWTKAGTNTIMMPFSTAHMPIGDKDSKLCAEIREIIKAGAVGGDPQEVFNLRVKHWGLERALSWIDEATGGALVAPPMMGELIELFRNNEVFMNLGARDIGMPPSGRITYPRQTSAATAYWVGESTTITDSTPGVGDLVLTAKKLGVLVKIPNELFRFASVAIEQFVRSDIAAVMALALDLALLEGVGSSVKPKGIINYDGIQTHTAATVDTNGDTFEPEDVGDMIGKVEERNAQFKGWVMRPRMYGKLRNRRSDAVAAGDKKGPFVFDMLRSVEDSMNRGRGIGALEGYPVVKSTQVSQAREKGSATDLTYILGGDFTDFVMALGGVIEFLVSNQGDTMVEKDQTWVRGIQYVDGAPRHEASFIVADDLVVA